MAPQRASAVLDDLAGDVDAGYPAFVRAHAGAVYTTALRLSGSRADADDLAQETFIRAYKALQEFDADRVLSLESRAWLLTITLNLWRNALRRAARRPRETSARQVDVTDARRSPEAAAEAGENAELLVGLLRELPEHHRVPVVLRHIVGLSYAEMASVLECPVGTAKANVARGLDRLRALASPEKNKEVP
ncbi:MAG TPA: RNA polymerase sigma factor [Acidimicrobiales bacterium]|nr:RNA polymerase sigma factor [Acidimicrobiales bacterium]